jgi:hypothetical protein
MELSFGKELINTLRGDSKYTFKKYKFDKGGKKFSFKDTFNIYGEYNLLIVPNDNSVEIEFVSLTPVDSYQSEPTTAPQVIAEPNSKIKELSDKDCFSISRRFGKRRRSN